MRTLQNGTRLIESTSELPDIRNAKRLYGDFETTSLDDKKKSTSPWHDCHVAGIGVAADDGPVFYVPVNHRHGTNLSQDAVADWWCDAIDTAGEWVNQNVKYDAHVSALCLGALPECKLGCTLTRSKIIDSDRMRRSLDVLSKDWLGEDISQYEAALKPYLASSKDYGRVPPDVMGAYCGQDIFTTRRLDKYERAQLPAEVQRIWDLETDMTTVLFHMERHGMRVDRADLAVREIVIWNQLSQLEEELTKLVGRWFRPDANADCFDVLCNQYGLPVLAWTEEPDEDDDSGEPAGNPSFDKHALAQYMAHPFAPHEVVKRIIAFRKLNTMKNFFVKKYQNTALDARDGDGQIMHPSYNQIVRTGRMSCKDPNAQQLSKDAKELIRPRKGKRFVSIDDSQVEFRTIIHYIQDPYAIRAYAEDPDTDFHKWVAEMIGIKRKPAKTANFLMAFGGGKEKLLQGLEANMDLVGDLKDEVERLVALGECPKDREQETFKMLARRRAEDTYTRYHETLPGLKRTSRQVTRVCQDRGYVYNLMGRRRHLPRERAHIAFNTLNQSSAADMMKARMVALHKYVQEHKLDVQLVAQVHDELLLEMDDEVALDSRTRLGLMAFMETPPIELRVPLRCAMGTSAKHWREACSDEEARTLKYDREQAVLDGLHLDPLRHLIK